MPYSDADLLNRVNDNGYLLQQVVEHQVNQRARGFDGWTVVGTEHFWQDRIRDKSGYVDSLIANQHGILAVVECKRVKEDTPWIFLNPRNRGQDNRPEGVRNSKLHWVHHSRAENRGQQGLARFFHGPITMSAKFCIVVGQTNERPMLERVAGELLYAAEEIGRQQLAFRDHGATMLLPMIVTNASLYACEYGLDRIDPINGILRPEDAQITQVPYIRFEKVFTESPVDYTQTRRMSDLELHQRQTVMVVNSTHLGTFLEECQHVTATNRYGEGQWPWHAGGQ